MIRVAPRVAWLVACLAFAGGCERPVPDSLPPLPELKITDDRLPRIREQIAAAVKRVENSPLDAGANGELGMIFHAYGDYATAAALYARAHTLAPRDARWNYYYGQMLLERGNADAALARLRVAAARYAGEPAVQATLADALLRSGRINEGLDHYAASAGRFPGDPHLAFAYGNALVQAGQTGRAIEWFERSIANGRHFGQAYYALALAHQRQGDLESAGRYRQLFERHKGASPPRNDSLGAQVFARNLGEIPYLNRGNALLAAGRHAKAVEAFERAVEINPEAVSPYATLVGLYALRGDADRAESAFARAVAIDENRPKTWFNLGILRHTQQRFDDAVTALERAVELDPTDPATLTQLGLSRTAAGDTASAINAYRRALELAPAYPEALTNLATLLLLDGRAPDALALLRRPDGTPSSVRAADLRLLALAHAELGQWSQALASIDAADAAVDSAREATLANQILRDRGRIRRAAEANR